VANDIQKLYDLPEVSFIEDIAADTLLEEMITDFQDKYYELTGEYETLGELDKYRILMNASVLKIYQAFQNIEKAGKMNLLKYATGDYLDNLGATRGITRNPAKAATCTVKFSLSQAQNSVISILAGTQITAGDGVYFITDNYSEIPAGSSELEISATCQTEGTVGNGYVIGQLNTIVEPIAYISSVTNITESSGGEDVQSDDSFREKIFLAPSGYSTAGPEDAYIYWAKAYSAVIGDIKVITPADDTVQLIILLKEGVIPEVEFLNGLQEYLSDGNIKPMTEFVTVTAPDVVNYDVTGTYYINRSNKDNAVKIQAAVTAALDEYVSWQKEKIGRDLNPFHLQYLLVKAGVKRIELISPTYLDITDTTVAIANEISMEYGGIEDD
jgi:phage-related baseplate assembly protein